MEASNQDTQSPRPGGEESNVSPEVKSNTPKSGYRKLFVIMVVLLLGMFLVLCMYIGLARVNKANQVAATCKDDTRLINDYNQKVHTQGAAKVSDIAKRVQQKKQYKQDATCIYILMVSEYGAQDKTKQSEMYHQLQSLEAQGNKTSPSINDGINRKQLENIIQKQDEEKGTAHVPGEG